MALPQHCIDLINHVRAKYPDEAADAVPDRNCGRLVRVEDYQRFLAFVRPTRTLFDAVA